MLASRNSANRTHQTRASPHPAASTRPPSPGRREDAAGRGVNPNQRTTMDPNKLTQKTQEALHDGQTIAVQRGHTEVDVEHVLLALLKQEAGLVPRLLSRMDVPVETLTTQL